MGRALLDAIFGADHAGFPRRRWAAAFVQCCAEMLVRRRLARAGATWRVTHRGHVTEVAVHPSSRVDAPALRERAQAADVQAHIGTLESGGGRPGS